MLEVTPVSVRCKLSITKIKKAAIPILLRVLGSLFLTKGKSISSYNTVTKIGINHD